MKNWQAYSKFWVALAAPLGVLLVACAPTTTEAAFIVTQNELYGVLVALAAAVGVYSAPNKE